MEKHGEIREDITPSEEKQPSDGTLKEAGSSGHYLQGTVDALAEQHPVSRAVKHVGRRLAGRVGPISNR